LARPQSLLQLVGVRDHQQSKLAGQITIVESFDEVIDVFTTDFHRPILDRKMRTEPSSVQTVQVLQG